VAEDAYAMARHCWEMAERVGTKVAELAIETREVAFAGIESCLREAGSERGVGGQQLDAIVYLQVGAIRQVVADIDAISSRDARPPHLSRIAER
jgi:hypothetical protein